MSIGFQLVNSIISKFIVPNYTCETVKFRRLTSLDHIETPNFSEPELKVLRNELCISDGYVTGEN